MPDVVGLRSLIDEYGQLANLSGSHTPQTRGIRFTELFAEMLGCWGIDAAAQIQHTNLYARLEASIGDRFYG